MNYAQDAFQSIKDRKKEIRYKFEQSVKNKIYVKGLEFTIYNTDISEPAEEQKIYPRILAYIEELNSVFEEAWVNTFCYFKKEIFQILEVNIELVRSDFDGRDLHLTFKPYLKISYYGKVTNNKSFIKTSYDKVSHHKVQLIGDVPF